MFWKLLRKKDVQANCQQNLTGCVLALLGFGLPNWKSLFEFL